MGHLKPFQRLVHEVQGLVQELTGAHPLPLERPEFGIIE
jgi:hypothetical protein